MDSGVCSDRPSSVNILKKLQSNSWMMLFLFPLWSPAIHLSFCSLFTRYVHDLAGST